MPQEIPDLNLEKTHEMTEEQVFKALVTGKTIPKEIQEKLDFEIIKDPNYSMYVLGAFSAGNISLSELEAERLFKQALENSEVVEIFYITLTESGAELNKNEKSWLPRLQLAMGIE